MRIRFVHVAQHTQPLSLIISFLLCVGLGCLPLFFDLSTARFHGIVLASQAVPPKYVSAEDNIKFLWLSNEKLMYEGMREMDMHWAYRLAVAEKLGGAFLDRELKEAPRTLGDGLPWPEHFKKRADRNKLELDKKTKAVKEFEKHIFEKYKVNTITFEPDGKMKLGW